jgi:hypothetical protein
MTSLHDMEQRGDCARKLPAVREMFGHSTIYLSSEMLLRGEVCGGEVA